MSFVSYNTGMIPYWMTTMELKQWQKQNLNHTNFEEIKMELFRIEMIMNGSTLIMLSTLFFLDLSCIGRSGIIQLWREKNFLRSRFILCTIFYLFFAGIFRIIPFDLLLLPNKQYFEVNEILKNFFFFSF